MDYEKPDIKAVKAWRISRIIGLAILAVFLTAILVAANSLTPAKPFVHYGYIAAGILILYKIIGLIVYPSIEYRQWRYSITEEKVEIRHGIFFLTTTVIPIIRIQHITMSRGPIYRKLGLSKVEISLASGSFEIDGLNENTANTISEMLRAKVLERLNKGEQL